MSKIILYIMLISFPMFSLADELKGYVYEKNAKGEEIPVPGVTLNWAGTQTAAVTNQEGWFSIKRLTETNTLIIRHAGYADDSLEISTQTDSVFILMNKDRKLKTFVLTEKRSTTFISRVNPVTTEIITGAELQKAACCNLGESFETNASVDVSYGDAISGSKKIELLGLAGIYSQILLENMPDYKGFGRTFGLNYIPGHWLESISVSKGASAVTSGNESITGQISVDYKKPDGEELFYLNTYANNFGKFETNANFSQLLSDKLSTMLLGHFAINQLRIDNNEDSFMDIPLSEQYHFLNRWKYSNEEKGINTQWAIGALSEERLGGQMDYEKEIDEGFYGFNVGTKRYHAFWKGGKVFKKRKSTSLAMINNVSWQNQDAEFGNNMHSAKQFTSYHSLIFLTYLGNTNHNIRTGVNYVYGNYDESFNDTSFLLTEKVPGIFAQYTYTYLEKITLMSGIRADIHNLYGFQLTPRMHLRYAPHKNTTIRLSAGRGFRTPHLFAENLFLLATSKEIILPAENIQESAWNYGIHLSQYFKIKERDASINAEYFRTDFQNQMIVDLDQNINKVYVYNLDGRSYANNYQVDLKLEPVKRLDVLLAIRYSDVKTTINGSLKEKPFTKNLKGLVNLSYATKLRKWQFDFTAQLNGKSRLPENIGLPVEYQREDHSPAYTIINAQIAKYFRDWNIYLGVENLTNFKQSNPIIAADDPFGQYFDASQVWGPVIGRKIYIGMRYTIKRG
jgi:outer membrane receptor for ferrienterochelin and colicins